MSAKLNPILVIMKKNIKTLLYELLEVNCVIVSDKATG